MIPKIIHQIWEEKEMPISDFFIELSQTWKENHPDWTYIFWDKERMHDFIENNCPDFKDIYHGYHYDIQRWDAIRYFILFQMGGLYVDVDYECLESVDKTLQTGNCFFASEPQEHAAMFKKDCYFNNAFMATVPQHPFFELIINHLKEIKNPAPTDNKMIDVLSSTGPLMVTGLYEKCTCKNDVILLPAELVSPWNKQDVEAFLYEDEEKDMKKLEEKLSKAIAIHYFWGSW